MALKPGSTHWFRTARGGAGVYAAAVPGLLLLMAMEPTPELLRNTAWILAILGLLVSFAVLVRLQFLKSDAGLGPRVPASERAYRDRMRTTLAMFGWFNLGVFVLCGLVWIFAAQAQCLIQGWILGRVVAQGCG